jgi:localization factor PodJL
LNVEDEPMSFGGDSTMESHVRAQSAELPKKLYEAFVMDQSPLDALAERIARIGRRESETAPVMMQSDQSHDSVHLTSLVEKAIAAMDDTLRRNEDKTATALESVAKWMERNDQARAQSTRTATQSNSHQDAALARTMSLLVDRLDELDAKISNQSSPAASGMRDMLVKIETRLDTIGKLNPMERNAHGVERSLRELDGRLSEISERLDPVVSAPMQRNAVRQRNGRERSAPSQMMADIAARQNDLDGNNARQKMHDLGARVDRHQAEETRSAAPVVSATIDTQAFDALRKDIASLSDKINKATSVSDDKTVRSLQSDLQGIASAVNGLAPREQVSSIEAAIQNLALNIETSREATVREAGKGAQASSANLERQFKTLISKLDEAHPTNDIAVLAHNIECLQLKLDTLSQTSFDDGILQKLHHQTTQIGEHLNKVAAKPTGFEAIEDRLASLSAQLERGSTQGGGVDNKTFVDLSSRIERIQDSIDDLAVPAVDTSHIEVMVQKLNTKIDSISERAMDMQGFETAIRTLETKLDQAPKQHAQSVDLEGFEKAIRDLELKLDNAPKHSGSQSADIKGFEQAIRALEAKLDSAPKSHAAQTVDMKGFVQALNALEVKLDQVPKQMAMQFQDASHPSITEALYKISTKIDAVNAVNHVGGSSGDDITRIIRALEDKIDTVQLNANSPREFENLVKSVEDKISSIQVQAIDTKQLDKMVNDLTKQMQKAQRPDASDKVLDALQEQVSRLSEKLDKSDDNFTSLGSLEQTIGDIFSQLDSVKFASQDAAESAARNAVRDAMLEFKPHAAPENNDVKHILSEFSSIRTTQDQSDRRTQDTLAAVHDTLEKIVDRLGMLEGEVLAERTQPAHVKVEHAAPKAASTRPAFFSEPEPTAKFEDRKEINYNKEHVEREEPAALRAATPEQLVPYKAPIIDNFDYSGSDAVAQPKPVLQASTLKPIQSFSNDIDPDLPLDPSMTPPALQSQSFVSDTVDRAKEAKSNFIAAARKAAQVAAEEAAIALEKAKEEQVQGGRFNNAKQAVSNRAKSLLGYRKPILLGLAAIVVAAGGATVYKNMIPNTVKTADRNLIKGKEDKIKDDMTTGSNAAALNIQTSAPAEPAISVLPLREPTPAITIAPKAAPAPTLTPTAPVKAPRVSDAKPVLPMSADPIQVGTIVQRNLSSQGNLANPNVALNTPAASLPAASLPITVSASTAQTPTVGLPAVGLPTVGLPAANLPAASLPSIGLPALARPIASSGQNISGIQSGSQVKMANTAQISPVEDLKKLAESGDARAQYELGSRYVDGLSVARDPKIATLWLEKASAQGLAPAQYRLGSLYRDGKGLRNDSKLAHSWFKRSAEQGNARAMHNLAVVLAEGVTGAPDYAGAAEWFQKGAEHGIKDSQFNVAILFARGLGISQDLVQSYKWFAVSAALGDEDAAKKRDEVGAKLTPEKLEEAKLLAQNYKPKLLDAVANDIQPAAKNTPVAAANRQGNS